MVSRRALLAALPATALAAVPAHACENPADRVCRLLDELSQALGEYCDGSFRAIVEPANMPNGTYWLRSTSISPGADPRSKQSEDLSGLKRAIVRHQRAWEALEASCDAADRSSASFDPIDGEKNWRRRDRAEERAKLAFLRYPATSTTAQRLKAAHLRRHQAALDRLSPVEWDALIEGMERASFPQV